MCLDVNVLVIFSQDNCTLQDLLTKNSLPLGRLTHGLHYTIDKGIHTTERASYSLANVVNSNKMMEHAKLWHNRLGHAPISKIKILFPHLDIRSMKDSFLCTICPASRKNKLSFHGSYIKTKQPFDLLHIDTWGPDVHQIYIDVITF